MLACSFRITFDSKLLQICLNYHFCRNLLTGEPISNPQISAYISEETKKWVEEYVATYGVKKGFFIETAILHHLQALQEIPGDLIVSPKILVSQQSGEKILLRCLIAYIASYA